MSGPFGAGALNFFSGAAEFYSHTIDQSVRFNDDDTANLTRNFASNGTRTTWTFSCWLKRASINTTQEVFVSGLISGTYYYTRLEISASNKMSFLVYNDANQGWMHSANLLRDVGAWYHLVWVFDTTNATASDRMRMYINGERVTSFATETFSTTYPSLNGVSSIMNSSYTHKIGRTENGQGSGNFLDGYLAEVNFIDGTALDASSFGETKAGIWVPIEYTGSYGTNGFYLNFKDDIVSEGFNTVTYQGKGATQSISGLGFEPDFVWVKERSSTSTHMLADSVRGAGKQLESSNAGAEITSSAGTRTLSSFDADGFSVEVNNQTNENGQTYVAWCWDAGTGSAASNTNGDITSTVKANTAYGFSVVQFESDGVNEVSSVGHGLGTAPSFIITKNIDSAVNWACYHTDLGNNYRINLNQSNAAVNNGQQTFGSAADTFSVWKSNLFGSGTCIAYCFAEISGYSKFGSYTGTGATGNKITTGFEPAFVMVKSYDQTRNWIIWDNTRTPTNPADGHFHPNGTVAEQTGSDEIQFDSDGFTFLSGDVDSNTSSYNYIYMAFADTRDYAFWKDQSGNGNHFQPENLEYTDTLKDTPTSNFPTMNKLWQSKGTWTTAEGNLQNTWGANNYQSGVATMGLPATGKWYWEIYLKSRTYTDWLYWNLVIADYAEGSGNNGNSAAQWSNHYFSMSAERSDAGYLVVSSGSTNSIAIGIYDTGDVIQVAFDADNKRLYLGKSGTWFLSADPSAESGDSTAVWYNWSDDAQGKLLPALNVNYFTYVDVFNFGQDSTFAGNLASGGNADANGIGDFAYSVPSGYLSLCAANLPAPGIDPAADEAPEDYFNTVLYSGNSTARSITGVGFQPDFTWIKQRATIARRHHLQDSVRGAGKSLFSNDTTAEESSANYLTSFDSDGFSLGSSSETNGNTHTYVAWNWKAGGTAVSNTDGSVTSSVSASPESGFSIVKVDSLPASTLSTFGHGLGVKPDLIIFKSRNNTTNWDVYHSSLTPDGERKLYLNTTSAEIDSGFMGDTPPTASVISFNPGSSTSNHIALCFANIDGMVKAGSYVVNGSTDGAFVYTGFRPAWLLVKGTNVNQWFIYDTKRAPFNEMTNVLYPAETYAEASGSNPFDFTSSGFKLRTTSAGRNASGQTYIYIAFAEQPFKYANAR